MALERSVVRGCQMYPWRVSCLRSLKLFVECSAITEAFSCPWIIMLLIEHSAVNGACRLSIEYSDVHGSFCC